MGTMRNPRRTIPSSRLQRRAPGEHFHFLPGTHITPEPRLEQYGNWSWRALRRRQFDVTLSPRHVFNERDARQALLSKNDAFVKLSTGTNDVKLIESTDHNYLEVYDNRLTNAASLPSIFQSHFRGREFWRRHVNT